MGAVTPPWPRRREKYGTDDTYMLASEWLYDCPTVADWGGANGYCCQYFPLTCRYHVVDGTYQDFNPTIVADLRKYCGKSAGILLRHVVDNTLHWQEVLRNAVASFEHRMVVVTFTPAVAETTMIDKRWGPGKRPGYPYWHFNHDDLRREMAGLIHSEHCLQTTHPERLYFLERR